MFRKSPYWGWLLLALLLWSAAGYHYAMMERQHRPAVMAGMVSRDLQRRLAALHQLERDTAAQQRIVSGHLRTPEIYVLEKAPFYLFAYRGDSLVFWNTNEALPPVAALKPGNDPLPEIDGRRVVPRLLLPDSSHRLLALIPVARSYLVENKYLSSGFLASPVIPADSRILPDSVAGSYPVSDAAGHPLFYLQVPREDVQPWVPDAQEVVLCLAALFCSLIWIQLLILFFTRRQTIGRGLLLTALVVAGIRALTYYTGLPFNLGNLHLFSSELYGYNWFLPSLGDLLLNVLCLLWVVIFAMTQLPYRSFFGKWPVKWYNYVLAFALLQVHVLMLLSVMPVLRSVVVDSQLSFDMSHFYAINLFTILGLFTIGLIVSISALITHFVNILVGNLVPKRWQKYLLLLLVLVPLIGIASQPYLWLHLDLAIWVLLFIIISDLPRMSLSPDLFSPTMIFWSVFICVSVTMLMNRFIASREQEKDRIAFASHVLARQDLLMEYNFTTMANNLEHDSRLLDFVRHPTEEKRSLLDDYLSAYYFSRQFNQYQPALYLFDNAGRGLFNADTNSAASLQERLNQAMPSVDLRLYFNENAADDHYYLAQMYVYDSLERPQAIVYLDLSVKSAVNETLYPELLQPANVSQGPGQADYAYAIYTDGHLKYQKGDYQFPVTVPTTALPAREYEYRETPEGRELWYQNQHRLVIVPDVNLFWVQTATFFSCLFGLQMLLYTIGMLYRMTLEYFLRPRGKTFRFNLTLRRRIHFSMLAMVVISFLVIGSVTIYFFSNRYQSGSYRRLQGTVKNLERQIMQFFSTQDIEPAHFDQICRTPEFRRYLTAISENQNTDLSIFDPQGRVMLASQEDVYAKDLLAPLMLPHAFHQMQNGRSILLQREKIGSLSFLSAYISLRNDKGDVLGYLNIPFYSSEKELKEQISGILVTLINLYAFLFLLSSLLALVIINSLTRSLDVIINQFERLNLQRNELLEWPYNDEIGVLVREYNKMVRKLEENAAMLAQSEREGAWREMARQIAHEIKNPLTPMKLNIQYLQQALKSNHPQLTELTARVSGILIEQIDHLSHIASEFSSFARMPDARPEVLNLRLLLCNVVDLFRNEPGVAISLNLAEEEVYVYVDRSQMIRVYTNLLQNAIQALDEERKGQVEVKLTTEDGYACTMVTDNGKGISEEVQERLFKPYFTTKSSGTGLGLAMTKKIVELWKGSIWFESKEQEGTTFYIRLPLSAEIPAEDA